MMEKLFYFVKTSHLYSYAMKTEVTIYLVTRNNDYEGFKVLRQLCDLRL
jgi:hypothetical protein